MGKVNIFPTVLFTKKVAVIFLNAGFAEHFPFSSLSLPVSVPVMGVGGR